MTVSGVGNEFMLHPARWWEPADNNCVICRLCPRRCVIAVGKTGFCAARINNDGQLFSLAYGRPVSVNIDPIEKKPLACFMPGTKTFSFGTFGCNLGCEFCQNSGLSRGTYREQDLKSFFSPEVVVQSALRSNADSISFTYNEPTVFAEYAIDIAILAKKSGLPLVLVSNGYISDEAACELYTLIDAANIDMKSFSSEFYSGMCGGERDQVLRSLEYFFNLGKHLEITTLLIPGKNDTMSETAAWLDWVEQHLGKQVPLHFSAYHPSYRCTIAATPRQTVLAIQQYAKSRGFKAFVGNI